MKICMPHWERIQKALPEASWLAANQLVFQSLYLKVPADAFDGDPERLQEAIHAQGGCPACFVKDFDLIEQAIKVIKSKLGDENKGYL